jgi:hypothetical protein
MTTKVDPGPPVSFATSEELFREMSKRCENMIAICASEQSSQIVVWTKGNWLTHVGMLDYANEAISSRRLQKPESESDDEAEDHVQL